MAEVRVDSLGNEIEPDSVSSGEGVCSLPEMTKTPEQRECQPHAGGDQRIKIILTNNNISAHGLTKFNVNDEDFTKCVECINVLANLAELYKIGPCKQSQYEKYHKAARNALRRLLEYVEVNGEGSWIPYMKYKITAYFSYFHEQPIPSKPKGFFEIESHPGCVLDGIYRKRVTRKDNRLQKGAVLSGGWFSERYSYSVLMSKKGMPRAGTSQLREAARKTVMALTTCPGLLPKDEVIEGKRTFFTLSKESMCEQLDRTVDEIFSGLEFGVSDMSRPFFPSTSANYINSRDDMGSVGIILDEIVSKYSEDLLEFKNVPVQCYQEQSEHYGQKGREDQQTLDELFEQGKEETLETLGVSVDTSRLEARWKEVYWKCYKAALTECPLVKPVALAEALKIRIISKGPPFLYTVLKPLQLFMWSTLQRNPVFELIGKPVTQEIINSCLGDMNMHPRDIIISGDYKASTDNLHNWVSERIAKRISANLKLSSSYEEMFLRSLTRHVFEIESETNPGELLYLPQEEGQLMGSVTSFPVLCLANAAMCRWSMEEASGRIYRLNKSIPLRINGDDCVFRGDKNLLPQFWEKITSYGGLESSIGKTYYSTKFAVINSVLFDIVTPVLDRWAMVDIPVYKPSTFVERKYINLGLVYGLKRSAISCDSEESILGPLHQELFKSCPKENWKEVNELFIYKHANQLKRVNVPWYIPEWAGGYGLVGRPSKDDRLIVSWIKELISNLDPSSPVKVSGDVSWKMHKHVLKRMKPLSLAPVFHRSISTKLSRYLFDVEENFAKIYKYMTIETLFRQSKLELYGLLTPYKIEKNLLHNENIWNRGYEMLMSGQLLRYKRTKLEDLASERKVDLYPVLLHTQCDVSETFPLLTTQPNFQSYLMEGW